VFDKILKRVLFIFYICNSLNVNTIYRNIILSKLVINATIVIVQVLWRNDKNLLLIIVVHLWEKRFLTTKSFNFVPNNSKFS